MPLDRNGKNNSFFFKCNVINYIAFSIEVYIILYTIKNLPRFCVSRYFFLYFDTFYAFLDALYKRFDLFAQ